MSELRGIAQIPGDRVLLYLGAEGERVNPWTVLDACEGTQIFGGTGSGKTSGSGAAIARAFLKAGFGGLVLTAKGSDRKDWEAMCQDVGRSEHLVLLDATSGSSINFMDYESVQQHATTHDLVSFLLVSMEGGTKRESKEPFWDDAMRQMLTNTIDIIRLAKREVTIPLIVDIVRSAPQTVEEASTWWMTAEELRKMRRPWMMFSTCARVLAQAERHGSKTFQEDYEESANYWLKEYAGLSDKTRSIITTSFMSKITGLLRSPFRRMFCGKTSEDGEKRLDIRPERTFEGRILLLDLPIKRYGESGRLAQVLYKTLWQRAVERRADMSGSSALPSPVFLWADESQYFVTSQDMTFQQTARSSRAATVYLTQNLPNYYAMMGEGNESSAVTDSLLGNLQTKIFHANGDPVTNEWGQRLFGEYLGSMKSTTESDEGTSETRQEAFVPLVPARVFTKLTKGGEVNSGKVEGIVFQGGRVWAGANADRNALRHVFLQNVKPREQR